MDEDGYNENNEYGLSLRSFILPAILIAICNLVFLQPIRNFLVAGLEQHEDKRFRYTAYFAVNIFIYIFIVPLFLGTMFAPILPSVFIAIVIGYYISTVLFPAKGEEKKQKSVEDDISNQAFVEFLKSLGLDKENKLTFLDGRTIKNLSEGDTPPSDIINEFIMNISAQDPNSLRKLSSNYNTRNDEEGITTAASSRDILFALITCCDPILLQDVICKLSRSGNAVPLFVPDQDDTSKVNFLLWGLRKTTLFKFDSKTELVQTVEATNFPVCTISAIRFGEIPVSKSDVLNTLMSTSYACENRESFLNYKNDPRDSVWSKGTIECDWFLMENSKQHHSVNISYSLFNLRGDGRVFKKQVQLCTKISNIVVLFTNSAGNDDLKDFIETETTSAHIILVICSESDISFKSTSRLSVVLAKDLDTTGVSQAVLDIVRANYRDKKGPAIEDMVKICEELSISVDEQQSNYQTAKSQAIKTIGNLTPTQNMQKEFRFPLQALRKEWIKIDSEEIEGDNIEIKIADKLERKEAIRLRQVSMELSDEFRDFLSALNFEREQRKLYFAWLQIVLNHRNDNVLKPHREELCSIWYKRKEAYNLMNEGGNQSFANENEKKLENISSLEKECRMKYDGLKIDLDQYLIELGQAVECKYQLTDSFVESLSLPDIMANSMLDGIPLEIVDSEDCRSLLTYWLGEVFSALDTICQPHHTVRVVSVVGGPSTYKSTLLNSMFGVNFQVGVGKCSQGIFVQLVPVHSSIKQTLNCDYLLIIDSESLNTCEGKFSDVIERNNSIVTLLSCISDVVIVNIGKKTSQQEMQSLLEVVVRSLVKSKQIKGSAKFCLVQHLTSESNSDYNQDQKTLAIFEKVEEVIKKSTKLEGVDHKYPEIVNSFFSKEGAKNIKFVHNSHVGFPQLLNDLYSKDIMNLRHYLLQLIANCDGHAMSYVEFYQRVVDVTSALKTTNFVANFQDTNIENLKDDFIKQYREWILTVEQELMEKLTVACSEVTNSSHESIDEKLVEVKRDVTSVTKAKFTDLAQRVEEEIQSTKYESVKEQLQFFQKDITKNEEDFLQVIESSLEKSIERAKKVQQRDIRIHNETEKFLQKISETPIADSTQDELFHTFQETQGNYVEMLKGKYHSWDFDTIQDRTKSNMSYMLNQCGEKVEELIKEKELSEFAIKREKGFTMSDIHVLKDKFCISEDSNETIFEEARSDLKHLCDEHAKFETNSTKAVQIFKDVERQLHSVVESTTVYLFFSSKFICGVHRSQLSDEVHLLTKIIHDDTSDTTNSDRSIEHLWEMVDSETYEIQDAEPRKYPNLESKLEYFLRKLEKSIPIDNFLVLKEVLTVKNINNCYPLPFTLLALQRLDRYFIAMLPRMSPGDMDSIDNVVNDAKMTVISKAIAKTSLDFGGTFNEIYRMVQLCILDHDQKEEIQAAALVHLSAWSLDAFSIKRYEDEMENNVAISFQKLNKLFLAAYKTKLDEKCDELAAEIVCNEIHQALVACIEDETVHRLRESFLTKNNLFNVKRVFIGTILRDLCIHDDYNGFVNFLQNFDEFSEKWILKFLARECNKDNDSLLQNIVQNLIDSKIDAAVSAIEKTTSLQPVGESQTFSNWLSHLQQNMLTCCNAIFQERYLETLKTNIDVTDFDQFTDKLVYNLRTLTLKTSFTLPKAGSEDDTKIWLLANGGDIHLELSKLIKGCTTQCPFCGAACEDTLGAHEFHKTALHYPGGVKGWRDTVTDELFVKICTSAIASNATYRTPEMNFRPYKDYKVDYPDWDILAKDDQPMEFWKYVFAKFNKNFAKHYKCAKGNVPTEWMSYTKEQAIKSVEIAYKLCPFREHTSNY
ncbi:Interferon-induced very large GTPase 1 [Holothuria leucospilota]|uniref:Interferon-induced very large GTPase 1 n=1 Tax=Holothuria leucospilota TaxID=206669 RepID=A0A9Q1C3H1_HOLLE|nr:Interferon-induced very large GTPase 1 [Holothuria leucospilota]